MRQYDPPVRSPIINMNSTSEQAPSSSRLKEQPQQRVFEKVMKVFYSLIQKLLGARERPMQEDTFVADVREATTILRLRHLSEAEQLFFPIELQRRTEEVCLACLDVGNLLSLPPIFETALRQFHNTIRQKRFAPSAVAFNVNPRLEALPAWQCLEFRTAPDEASALRDVRTRAYERLDVEQMENGVTVARFRDKKLMDAKYIATLATDLMVLAAQEQPPQLILDFQRVEFVASQALNKLIILHDRIQKRRGRLIMCTIDASVNESAFFITRLDKQFEIVASVKQAQERLLKKR